MAVSRNTGPTTVHTLDVRLSVLESRYETIDEKLDRILEASGQGHPPTPKRARPKADDSGEDVPVRKGVWGLVPGTGKEVAIALSAVVTTASSLMAMYYAIAAGDAAYKGANQGANQAVEDAVEQAEAIPVAPPPVVVPVPHAVPVPVPTPTPADVGAAAEAGGLSSEILPSRAAED